MNEKKTERQIIPNFLVLLSILFPVVTLKEKPRDFFLNLKIGILYKMKFLCF